MNLRKDKKKGYILVAAICILIIGFFAAYFSAGYANAEKGSFDGGMYAMLKYIQTICSFMGPILFLGFVVLLVNSKNKGVEEK